MEGYIVIDKPSGITSAKVVAIVKGITRVKKVGHTGTLDPLATGILPIALGRGATKTISLVMNGEKEYVFTVKWGEETDTLDMEGVVEKTDENNNYKNLTKEQIIAVLPKFVGDIEQTPPIYSAIKINGKRACDRVRAGEEVEIKPRIVKIYSLELLETSLEDEIKTAKFKVRCGKGTYVRSLARDIAYALDTCCYVTQLRRTHSSPFSEDQAITLDELRALESHESVLLPIVTE